MSVYLPIISSVLVFTLVIVILVTVLTLAERKLLPRGEVNILINDDYENSIKINPGQTLLNALSSNSIFLPSACGGGGTCAMCKCQVLKGGGQILSTELSHISRSDAKDNWRLGCQVKVREDMEIKISEEFLNIRKWECTVKSNENVATFIKELVLELPQGEVLNFQSGGYIQIDIPKFNMNFNTIEVQEEYHPDWDKYKIWDLKTENNEEVFRAYSMANHPAEGNRIMLNVRIATPPPPLWNDVPPGVASSYIFQLNTGDKVTISGPFGEFYIKETDREMVYIGGGAGMAPLRSHLFHLFHTLKTDRKVSFWYGARSLREMFYWEDFKQIEEIFPNFSFHLALSEPMEEDNWDGATGFIHQVVYDKYLSNHDDPTEIEYYMCGPPPMISAAENMLYDLGVEEDMIAYDKFG